MKQRIREAIRSLDPALIRRAIRIVRKRAQKSIEPKGNTLNTNCKREIEISLDYDVSLTVVTADSYQRKCH